MDKASPATIPPPMAAKRKLASGTKIKLEIVVLDGQVEDVIKSIIATASTGKIGDGKIFVSDINESVRIRTGDRGEKAI